MTPPRSARRLLLVLPAALALAACSSAGTAESLASPVPSAPVENGSAQGPDLGEGSGGNVDPRYLTVSADGGPATCRPVEAVDEVPPQVLSLALGVRPVLPGPLPAVERVVGQVQALTGSTSVLRDPADDRCLVVTGVFGERDYCHPGVRLEATETEDAVRLRALELELVDPRELGPESCNLRGTGTSDHEVGLSAPLGDRRVELDGVGEVVVVDGGLLPVLPDPAALGLELDGARLVENGSILLVGYRPVDADADAGVADPEGSTRLLLPATPPPLPPEQRRFVRDDGREVVVGAPDGDGGSWTARYDSGRGWVDVDVLAGPLDQVERIARQAVLVEDLLDAAPPGSAGAVEPTGPAAPPT